MTSSSSWIHGQSHAYVLCTINANRWNAPLACHQMRGQQIVSVGYRDELSHPPIQLAMA